MGTTSLVNIVILLVIVLVMVSLPACVSMRLVSR